MLKWMIKRMVCKKLTSLLQEVSEGKMAEVCLTSELWMSKMRATEDFLKEVLAAISDRVLAEEEADELAAKASELVDKLMSKSASSEEDK